MRFGVSTVRPSEDAAGERATGPGGPRAEPEGEDARHQAGGGGDDQQPDHPAGALKPGDRAAG